MDITLVSGTYNRLPYLQRMVETARAARGGHYGPALDFCLVDGGSQDGTQAWCNQQPDITLIEHGNLRGAVKAFNDGARAARGEYVIMANDDIEFLDDGILQAWIHMQSNPGCGAGCFYQDRNGQDWHVESMPAVSQTGGQIHTPYGQVCMVPKWLGDRVGWWGDYLHTYGGDNELSAQIISLGYKVSPVEGARIHDAEADDDLRKINNISGAKDPRAVRGHHPDSWAWGRAWRGRREHLQFPNGRNLVGPLLRDGPGLPNPVVPRERVVYLPIFEAGWAVQKQQKRGLREALARVGMVAEYDYVGRFQGVAREVALTEIQHLLTQVKPTLVLSQLHNGDLIGPGEINKLRHSAPGATWVNWNGDYWPENLTSEAGLALARAVDLQLTVNRK
ncbi:MAG: glycosyltransferase, partial [Planctomycetales bacterium]|nr:glycosyltransferase [Planctomycetales bacterium]